MIDQTTSRQDATATQGADADDGDPDQPRSPRTLSIEIRDAVRALEPDAARTLNDLARRAVEAALEDRPGPHEVRVEVVGDDRMSEIHLAHSGVRGTTDVLTFDLRDDPQADPGEPLDVDVVVCADEARRQADRRGHDLTLELLLYVLHGALHCLGHDDTTDAERDAMHAREDEILDRIGVGAVYARPETGPGNEP